MLVKLKKINWVMIGAIIGGAFFIKYCYYDLPVSFLGKERVLGFYGVVGFFAVVLLLLNFIFPRR